MTIKGRLYASISNVIAVLWRKFSTLKSSLKRSTKWQFSGNRGINVKFCCYPPENIHTTPLRGSASFDVILHQNPSARLGRSKTTKNENRVAECYLPEVGHVQ